MAIPSLLLQFGGSLAAILALAALARWLGLGAAMRLEGEADVERIAAEVVDGFVPVAIARDTGGRAALARDSQGQIMLIKLHGNRFAGRVLKTGAVARIGAEGLEVDCREVRFGKVTLALDDAEAWANAIHRLDEVRHA